MANENPNPPNPFNPDPEKNKNPNQNPDQNFSNQNPNIPNQNNLNNPNQNFGNPYQQGGYQNPYIQNPGAYYNPNVPPPPGGQLMPVPNSTAVLALGIISLVTWLCYGVPGLICAIIGMVLSKKGKEAYEANPGMYTQVSYSNLKAGRVCSIIGLILSILMIMVFIIALVFAIAQGTRNFSRW